AFSVVITGLIVVFIVLILLVIFCWISSKIFENIDKSKTNKSVKEIKTEDIGENITKDETVDTSLYDDEVIAVISAAVAMMMQDRKYVIKSINKRNSWNKAGITDNTSSF
ncbi:MAG: OadG family protein, partial [Oscillospiraceae bacterium]